MSDAPLSNEGNFLKRMKDTLEKDGHFDAMRDPKVIETIDKEVPDWIREFTGYLGGNGVPQLALPADFDQTQSLNTLVQSRQDRLAYCYLLMLPMYQKIRQARDLLAAYINIEVNEVSKLKNADMRAAAVNYILDEFNEKLQQLDMLYDVIEQVRATLNKVSFSIDRQMRLFDTKTRIFNGGKIT